MDQANCVLPDSNSMLVQAEPAEAGEQLCEMWQPEVFYSGTF